MSRHAQVGLKMLMERRSRDEAQSFYREAAAADNLTKQRADFESRTYSRYQAGELRRRAKKRSEEMAAEIDMRRQKLKTLLDQEDSELERELSTHIESPSARRARLLKQLEGLKSMRQKEHDDYVTERNAQAWRDQCDPLRYQISEALEKQVIAERDQQVIAHDLAKMESDAEEEKYVKQIQQNLEDWKIEQAREKEDKMLKTAQNRRVWTAEIEMHKKKAAERKQQEYEESLAFRTTTEQAIKQAQEAAAEKAAQQAARRKELDELNAEQITYRKRLLDQDRLLDTQYAAKAAEELRQQEEDELVEKLVRMRKAGMNQALLRAQLYRKKASEEEAERYQQAIQEEVERKEDEARAKDLAARRALLMDAVKSRVEMMHEHDLQKEEMKRQKELEAKELEADLAAKRQAEQEQRDQKQLLIHNQYAMLARQTQEREEQERKRKQEERDSVNAMIAGWQAEEEHIQQELKNPTLFLSPNGRFRGFR